jgi:hypothetical protein
VRIDGVVNQDWEDLAAFVHEGQPHLLVADVGDNEGRRPSVSVIAVPEPDLDLDGKPVAAAVAPAWVVRFRYPDGPRDAESVAVDSAAGQILVLSKRDAVARLYAVPLRPENREAVHTATFLGEARGLPRPADRSLPARIAAQPTGMDLTPDGQALVVLTYGDAFLFARREGDTSWADALAREPTRIALPPAAFGILPQREGIAVSMDGRSVTIISEGRPAQVMRIPLTQPTPAVAPGRSPPCAASGRSSRPCGSRRTGAWPWGRGGADPPCRTRRRSSRSP